MNRAVQRELCSQPSTDLYVGVIELPDGQDVDDILTAAGVDGHDKQGAEVPSSGHLVVEGGRRTGLDRR